MKLFLSGGAADGNPGYQKFLDAVDRTKPILYICFAVSPRNRIARYADFAARMAREGVFSTRMCEGTDLFDTVELRTFGGIFCSGGNTYRLLKALREHDGIEKIKAYLQSGGVWYGSSAGSVVCGADIQPICYMDPNTVALRDTRGLNLIGGWSTVAHYNSSAEPEVNAEFNAAVASLAQDYPKLLALPEAASIVVEDGKMYICGAPCPVFEGGVQTRVLADGEVFA